MKNIAVFHGFSDILLEVALALAPLAILLLLVNLFF